MESKRRLFVYDRKEVGVLLLLGVGVAIFAFTLGVHLGKQVIPRVVEKPSENHETHAVTTTQEQNPSRGDIAEQVKHVPEAVEEALDQTLRDEVANTGLQVESAKPLNYPKDTKTELKAKADTAAKNETTIKSKVPVKNDTKESAFLAKKQLQYMIQVGSYPSFEDAEPALLKLTENGLRAQIKEVDVKGKGKRYRLLVGDFSSVIEAEKAGKLYQKEKRISDFVVVRSTE